MSRHVENKESSRPPGLDLGHIYWNLRQALWWILTRDITTVCFLSKAGDYSDLQARYYDRLTASAVPESWEDPTFQQQLADAKASLRPVHYLLTQIGKRLSEHPEMIPECTKSLSACSLAVYQLETEAFSKQRLEWSKNQLFRRIRDGSIHVTGVPNGAGDPRLIERHCWPYYRLFSRKDGIFYAAPRYLKNDVLLRRLKENSATAQPTIWFDLLVEAAEIVGRWPVETAPVSSPKTKERRVDAETDQNMRDLHSRLRFAIRRIWPKVSTQPKHDPMARKLADDPSIKATGKSAETIRQILGNRYPPFQRLGLPPLVRVPETHS